MRMALCHPLVLSLLSPHKEPSHLRCIERSVYNNHPLLADLRHELPPYSIRWNCEKGMEGSNAPDQTNGRCDMKKRIDELLSRDSWTMCDVNDMMKSFRFSSFGYMYLFNGFSMAIDCAEEWIILRKNGTDHYFVMFTFIPDTMTRCFVEKIGSDSMKEEFIGNSVGVLNLNNKGLRWEGEMKESTPYGYGVLYENGRKKYEGFMIGEKKIYFGKEYYDDIELAEYVGCYENNKRFGKGILYNRDGSIEYKGLWKDNRTSSEFDGILVTCITESIMVPFNSFKEVKTFVLPSWLHSLKTITIENECLSKAQVFELDGLNSLKKILVGENSFVDPKRGSSTGGSFRVLNCPNLTSISVGSGSFSCFHSFQLSNLPSLQYLELGKGCFHDAESFELYNLPSLQFVGIDRFCFLQVSSFSLIGFHSRMM